MGIVLLDVSLQEQARLDTGTPGTSCPRFAAPAKDEATPEAAQMLPSAGYIGLFPGYDVDTLANI